jgi:hypothetical protein
MCYGCPFIWTINSMQGSLQEFDHGLGVVITIMDGVEKVHYSFHSGILQSFKF